MIVLETLGRRWFAFAFIAAFLWVAWPEGGWRRALRFLAIASVVSFAAEYSSTHNGFPYGRYDYIAHTRGDELYVSNVPLFVPLSFGTVVWAGRALALGARPARSLAGLALLGAGFAALIDFAIDPMTLRGSDWFLGDLYAYRAGGPYFDIPWSNFGGWLLVSTVVIGLDAAIQSWEPLRFLRRPRIRWMQWPPPEESWRRGRSLAFGMCAFFVVLALATRHWAIAGAAGGIGAFLVVAALALPRAFWRVEISDEPPSQGPPQAGEAGVWEPLRPAPTPGAGRAAAEPGADGEPDRA